MAQKAKAGPFSLRLYLDDSPVSRDIKATGHYEPIETKFVMQWVKQGNTVFDIGAHIGYYSLILSKLAGDKGQVFAFEPCVQSFRLLQENMRLNKCTNIFPRCAAVLDKTGRTRLYLNDENIADSRITQIDNANFSLVPCMRLDDFFLDYIKKIDFIKMDIQGAEIKALKGMGGILEKHEDIKLLIEFWPHGLRQCGDNPEDLLHLLLDCGFNVSFITKHRGRTEKINDVDVFLNSFSKHPGAFRSLLCKRS